MPRPRSAGNRSDISDTDMEGMMEREQEYQKLQRQYRIMQGDREAFTEESQNLIRRQQSEVKILEGEKQEILKDLRLAESDSNQNKDAKNTDTLTDLNDTQEDLRKQLEEEKQKQAEIDSQIRLAEREKGEQHKQMGGVHMSRAHVLQTQKKTRTLENRLDKANKEFNKNLTKNASLREEINSLRVERKRFEGMHKKMDKEHQQLKREIGDVIANSTSSYESRLEAQAKMMLLKEKADKDLQLHNAEMKELVRVIDHDRKLKEFMGIKGQERQEEPQLVVWRQKKEAIEAERKKENQEDSVESYEAAFEKIRDITGEEDIDMLVNKFIEVEDRNFALFNFVNEQNNETEKLQDQIEEIRNAIENFNAQGVEMETQREHILKDLEEKQQNASLAADEHNNKHKAVMKILDQLRAGIDSLFNKINCDRAAIDDMLGAQAGVSDQNMIQYLGTIEQRTNELLTIRAYVESKDNERYEPNTKAVGLLGEGPKPNQQVLPINPPTVGDEYESEASEASDDESRPFTRTELQSKVMKTVKKRESAARREGFKYDLSNAREKASKKSKKDKH